MENEPITSETTTDSAKFVKLKQWWQAYLAHKRWTIPVTVLAVLLIVFGIPFSRDAVLGLFLHHQSKITIYDAKTHRPVSGATVTIGGVSGKTDLGGNALLSPKLGSKQLVITKNYYTTVRQRVTVSWPGKLVRTIGLNPTGRLVPITLTNKISGKPVANALVKAAGTETHTDKTGKATIVLPTTAATQSATVSLNGYNTAQITIQVTDQTVAANNFMVTPAGKLYFLSNQSGKIDVVKTDLDGGNRQTVFAGTGSEDADTTSLLASRDWKYLVLLAKHNAASESLYLINTTNDQITNIDGDNPAASFSLVGWDGSTFVYQVTRSNVNGWQSGAQALKSYDAVAGKLYTIDQTQGEGTSANDQASNSYTSVFLLNDQVVFAKNWSSTYLHGTLSSKNVSLVSVNADGSNKKTIHDFPADNSYYYQISLEPYEPNGLYVQVPQGDGTNAYYTYDDGKLTSNTTLTDNTFYKPYPTYLQAPSGKQVFWSEVRDNKNTLFVGDADAKSPKQIAALSDYTPYGWYTDSYLLVSKNGSELYAMTPDTGSQPKKVTDYYKPQVTYRGYGGGYGGL